MAFKELAISTAGNNALPKVGARPCYFSYNSLSALVCGLTRPKKLIDNFIRTFLFIIAAGQTFFKTPPFGNAKRCTPFFLPPFQLDASK